MKKSFDVIIVLGAAVYKGGQPSPALKRRVSRGVELMKQKKADYLLLTGGKGKYPPAEAFVMRQLAISQGVLPEKIIMEDCAATTFESAVLCTQIMNKRAWKGALLVSDSYHIPRTKLTFKAFGVHTEGSPAKKYSPRLIGPYLREFFAIIYYSMLIIFFKKYKIKKIHQ